MGMKSAPEEVPVLPLLKHCGRTMEESCTAALWPFSLDQMESFNLWGKKILYLNAMTMAYDNFNVLGWTLYFLSEILAVTVLGCFFLFCVCCRKLVLTGQ